MPKSFSIVQDLRIQPDFESIVAMSVYKNDKPAWLSEAIDSILTQTYTNYVFAIVIDGPVPYAIKTIISNAALKDERILVVDSALNLGLSQCMNFVMDWSLSYHPKYFFRMDADDISLSQRLERQVIFLDKNESVDILGSSLNEINENGKVVGARNLPTSHRAIVRMLPKRCTINHPTVVFRFTVVQRGYRYNVESRNTQDYFFWIELAAAGCHFRNLKEPLLHFRRVNNFYKRRGIGKSINEFRARFLAMKLLKRYRIRYVLYAFAVLTLRLLPPFMVKLAYNIDRFFLNRK